MNRPLTVTLATAAVAATAVLVPLAATASSSSAACAGRSTAVAHAQATVAKDTTALSHASTPKKRTAAKRKLVKAQKALASANRRLTSCEVSSRPGATTTVTATAGATATATATATVTATSTTSVVTTAAPTVPAYDGMAPTDGTELYPMTTAQDTTITPDGNWDGTTIVGSGYGSALAPDTADGTGWFYGLTDRGPNVGGPDGVKMDPVQGFQPAIGKFHLVNGHAELAQVIGLEGFNGDPANGLVPPEVEAVQGNGDNIEDQYGATVPNSSLGIDSEGLVVDPAGGFFVSDEYGPYVVHYDATGKETYRYSPYVSLADSGNLVAGEPVYSLPTELARRNKNKGMEGLTMTPDHQYLVGIMQSPLQSNKGVSGTTAATAAVGSITRIVKIDIAHHTTQEYLYGLHFGTAGNAIAEANSEITALDDNHFVVDERDGCFEGPAANQPAGTSACPGQAIKNLWEADLTNATDVGPSSPLIGGTTTYQSSVDTPAHVKTTANSGLNLNGQSIEDIAAGLTAYGTDGTDGAVHALSQAGITVADDGNPAEAGAYLNYSGLLNFIDSTGQYFGHDKVEGVAIDPMHSNIVYLSDDSDFGITDVPSDGSWPGDSISHGGTKRALGGGALKLLPGAGGQNTGAQDFGEIVKIDLNAIPDQFTSTR